jgi:hypothetical protein
VLLFYLASSHAFTADSDSATVLLEGKALASGNLILHGWDLSLDSFWLIDAPFYALAYGLFGIRELLLHVVPAVIACLVVLVGAVMAVDGRRRGGRVAGVVTVVATLVLLTHTMSYFFLQGPLHVGTALWALLAFLLLRRGRFGWGWLAAVLFLAAGMNGDLLIVAYGIVPILLAGLVAMARRRDWRAGSAAVTAAVAGGLLGLVVREVTKALGGFHIAKADPIASLAQMVINLRTMFTYGGDLIGVRNVYFGTGGVPIGLQRVHIVEGVVLIACLALGVIRLAEGVLRGSSRNRRGSGLVIEGLVIEGLVIEGLGTDGRGTVTGDARSATNRAKSLAAAPSGSSARSRLSAWLSSEEESWRLDDMLTVACFGPPATYILLATAVNPQFTRDLTAAVIFVAILAARVIARQWESLRRLRLPVGLVGLACVACFAVGLGYTVSAPVPAQPADALVSWLGAHHLDSGVGAYWTASIATTASGGRVAIRPVVADSTGHLERYKRQSAASWYRDRAFRFLVYEPAAPFGGVDRASAVASWGPPERTENIGIYQILVWRRPFVVSPNRSPNHQRISH